MMRLCLRYAIFGHAGNFTPNADGIRTMPCPIAFCVDKIENKVVLMPKEKHPRILEL
jgi:hypothetical protein